MSSLASLVTRSNPLMIGNVTPLPAVKVLQVALEAAGYRISDDGLFGDGTFKTVQRFQLQHGLTPDGKVGPATAALLDAPHEVLIETAKPMTKLVGGAITPHDDTASLVAFYGDPDAPGFDANMVDVTPPFPLTYAGKFWPHPIQFHKKCAPLFDDLFQRIWVAAGKDASSPILQRISKFSGGHVNRPVRGSSRKSCHAFACAMDFDAEELPMGTRVQASIMPAEVIQAMYAARLFWGGDYVGRPDPMHVQAAHE